MDSTIPNFTDDPNTAHDESKTFADEKKGANLADFGSTIDQEFGMAAPPDADGTETTESLPYVPKDLDKNEREAVKQKDWTHERMSAEGIGKGCSIGGKVGGLGT